MHGECLLHKLETNAAREKYAVFIVAFSGRNYLKDAWRKTAWTYLLNGDTSAYFRVLKQIPDIGNDDIDLDKQAGDEAKNDGFVPNIDLLKVKLLFDGGYYLQADSILIEIAFTDLTSDQKLEFYYRKARIADESGSVENAKTAYLQTIENGKNSQLYFAGNAALKLAGIYESEENLAKAEYFYRSCLKMDFTEYETSIHSKAKAGLKRVVEKQD